MINNYIIHEQTRDYVYPIERNKLIIRARARTKTIKKCNLVYWNRHKEEFVGEDSKVKVLTMSCYARDNFYDYFQIEINTYNATRYIKYYFEIDDGHNTYYENYYGIQLDKPIEGYYEYLYTNENDIFRVPEWVKQSIFYQIFPERFYDGDVTNNPDNTVEWGSKPTRYNFMGGDIKGIVKKISYLQELGINAIYINPIFYSISNHKYDTSDYFEVDPSFGTKEDLKELVNICHKDNIKVILDGVFNHIGFYSKQFQDVIVNGENSKYKDWFYIEDLLVNTEKINYECVGYYKWMPKLRISNIDVQKFILDIVKHWIKETQIDGWRLDVADEIEYTFWQIFRKEIKSLNPECFILAETWKENKDMLRGEQMDSVMNYLFRDAVVDYFGKDKITSFNFDNRIGRIIGQYNSIAVKNLYNLIGSHDTARVLTLCNGCVDKLKLIVAYQMCFLGVPAIYYGDEIGLEGDNDPDCRKTMQWDEAKQNKNLLNWYRKLIKIRKQNNIFIHGDYKTVYCSKYNNVYGFVREYNSKRVYVVLNNSGKEEKIILPVIESENNIFVNLLNDEKNKVLLCNERQFYNEDVICYGGIIKLDLKPYEVKILLNREEKE